MSMLLFATVVANGQTSRPTDEAAIDTLDPVNPRTSALPREVEDVAIKQNLNTQLPLNLEFTDHRGKTVKLGDYFDGKHPVLLTLNYFKCPRICDHQLQDLVTGARLLDLAPGTDYRIVTISFDAMEDWHLAKEKRANYVALYSRPVDDAGWTFLTGRQPSIDGVLKACGWNVRWDDSRREWAHGVSLMVCTPEGKLSRYLMRWPYDEKTLRLSLVEASQGKIGTAWDSVVLFCFHYDDVNGAYAVAAMNIVRGGVILTIVIFGSFLAYLWRRDRQLTRERNAQVMLQP
jgi:protein SCO1/2